LKSRSRGNGLEHYASAANPVLAKEETKDAMSLPRVNNDMLFSAPISTFESLTKTVPNEPQPGPSMNTADLMASHWNPSMSNTGSISEPSAHSSITSGSHFGATTQKVSKHIKFPVAHPPPQNPDSFLKPKLSRKDLPSDSQLQIEIRLILIQIGNTPFRPKDIVERLETKFGCGLHSKRELIYATTQDLINQLSQ
jgi:hypothetical protein